MTPTIGLLAAITNVPRWQPARIWPQTTVIHQDLGGGRKNMYRPHFLGSLGNGESLLCWSKSQPYDGGPEVIYDRTRDFRTVLRDARGYTL